MNNILKKISLILSVALIAWGCTKLDPAQYFNPGIKVNYTLSSTSISPAVADSSNNVLTITWDNAFPDVDLSVTKYTVEIDSANGNFSRPFKKAITGSLSLNILGKDLNAAALALGYNFYQTVPLKLRLVSSLANNNGLIANDPKSITYTIYPVPAVKLPPSNKLYLVGSATPSGWSNPVPDSQSITRSTTDTFIWSGNITLAKNGEYVLLPVNGSWDNKYAVPDNTIKDLYLGGRFGYNASGNFPGPPQYGIYNLTVDFLHGNFKLTLVKALGPKVELPTNNTLWVVGGATPAGWDNSATNKELNYQQRFTRVTETLYEAYLYFNGGGEYKLVQQLGNWDNVYFLGTGDNATGTFVARNNGPDGPAFPAPATAGIYKVTVNFQTGTYSVVAASPKVTPPIDSTLWVIGSATAGGWDNSTNNATFVNNQKFTKTGKFRYELNVNLTAGNNEYKFIQQVGNWDNLYYFGTGNAQYGTIVARNNGSDGPSFPNVTTTGRYKIIVNFVNGTYYLEDNNSPVVAPPSSNELYIVGDATQGGWNNPVPVPLQKMTKISNTLYETYLNFVGGGEYLLLPVNGSWDAKFGVPNKSLAGISAGGDFTAGSENIPGTTTAGIYKMSFDFQMGKFTVTPVTPKVQIPDSIFMTGDASPGGWTNTPPANQKFTKINATTFQLTLNLTGTGGFILLPAYGSWNQKYALESASAGTATGGDFKYLTGGGGDIPGPGQPGNYTITFDFATGVYKIVLNN